MSAFDAVAARLLARATSLAAALIERRKREHWWRQPHLLWPDLTKD